MLWAKIFFVPVMIALIALIGRKFGARAAGLMSGFPIIGGPIVYFVFWEQGATFALNASQATLAGVVGLSSFGFVYAWLAPLLPWWLCLLLGWSLYAAVGVLLASFNMSPHIYAALAALVLLLQIRWSRPIEGNLTPIQTTTVEIICRMIFAATLVIMVTYLADRLGSAITGVLAAFPIASSVIAVFSHQRYSPRHAAFALRALKQGLISLLAFFYALVVLGRHWDFNLAFILAALTAVIIQILVASKGALFTWLHRR